ncbi:winged helix DNA-binding domain-containing protein [Spirosoma arcticum]
MNEIALRRLANQHIGRPYQTTLALSQPTDVVAHLVAMQAQEFAMAKWAVGLRLPTANEADVEQAFNSGQILRTHLLRPTWHFVTPSDIGWLLLLTAPRVKQVNAFMDRQCGLEAALFTQSNDLIATALAGNNYRTRDELAVVLNRANIEASGFRLNYIMMRAELDGIICSGPRRGNQFTYALLDERAPNRKPVNRPEALAELTKRYITSRGPATIHDFSTWSGLTLKEVTEGVAMNKGAIGPEIIDGKTYYVSAGLAVPTDDVQSTFLMPDYDEYGMGYKNRDAISHAELSGSLTYNRMIIVDGTIAGSWKRTISGSKVKLELQLNRPLTEQQRKRVAEAAEQYGQFIGKTVELVP